MFQVLEALYSVYTTIVTFMEEFGTAGELFKTNNALRENRVTKANSNTKQGKYLHCTYIAHTLHLRYTYPAHTLHNSKGTVHTYKARSLSPKMIKNSCFTNKTITYTSYTKLTRKNLYSLLLVLPLR